MIIVHDSIFNRTTDAIVNPVNCVGVMGAGLAKQFKARYPDMFHVYEYKCKTNMLHIGKLDAYYSTEEQRYIINFPTKSDYRKPSKIEYIERGLFALKQNPWGLTSISLPALGCGLGGLKFLDVGHLIETYLDSVFDHVELVLKP